MPVRLRITILFAILSVVIVGVLCSSIYYFSYSARLNTIKTRLINRSKTTARFLEQKEVFDQQLVRKIDSLTTISLRRKTIEAFDQNDRKIYSYSDVPGDTLIIDRALLGNARKKGSLFLELGGKETIIYSYTGSPNGMVVISAGEDTEGKQDLKHLLDILLLCFLISILLVFVIGYVFSTRLLRPIKKITEDIQEISAQSLARRIDTGVSKDEWYYLANTLNQLLNRLQDSFELQSRFIANASHELSTPLTSVSSQLEISLQREREADEYRKVMQSVYMDVQHMNKLTQTLLEFAKASGSASGLEITLIRIDEIIMELPSAIARMNESYSVAIEFGNLPDNEENLMVYGNEPLLSTAIKNIVLNACKYSDNHKAIIQLEINSQIIISIINKGSGIPKEEIDKIFQPFYRAIESLTGSKGFGLGLSLADRIIKLHKGSISVESVRGYKTSFKIYLPLANTILAD